MPIWLRWIDHRDELTMINWPSRWIDHDELTSGEMTSNELTAAMNWQDRNQNQNINLHILICNILAKNIVSKAVGRVPCGLSCLWAELPGLNSLWAELPGLSCPWAELPMGWVAPGWNALGLNCLGWVARAELSVGWIELEPLYALYFQYLTY